VSAWAWVAVALLGGTGALARVLLHLAISARATGSFPLGTLAVNVSGSLLLGLLSGLALHGQGLVLAGSALLGSYTTFSTWMIESAVPADTGRVRAGAVNVVLSLLAGLAAVAVGHALGANL
jgi:fluoride exporter